MAKAFHRWSLILDFQIMRMTFFKHHNAGESACREDEFRWVRNDSEPMLLGRG
jgi:hypothetical protein